jgi:hypothetical protein
MPGLHAVALRTKRGRFVMIATNDEMIRLSQLVGDQSIELERLRAELAAAREYNARLDVEHETQSKNYHALLTELAQSKDLNARMWYDEAELRSQITAAQSELAEAKAELAPLRTYFGGSAPIHDLVADEVNRLQSACHESQQEGDRLRKELAEARRDAERDMKIATAAMCCSSIRFIEALNPSSPRGYPASAVVISGAGQTYKGKSIQEALLSMWSSEFEPDAAKADQQQMAADLTVIQRLHDEQKASLYAELAEAKHTLNCCKEVDAMQDDEIARLKSENEAMRKDAERYRWLRESSWYIGPDSFHCSEGGIMESYDDKNTGSVALDREIDAALAAAQQSTTETTP